MLEIHIELTSLGDDNGKCRVEHYSQYPSVEYYEKYKLGLVDNHYFINGTTNVTSYCLGNYEEMKDISGSNYICRKTSNHDERDKTGKRFITAFQLFKILKIILIS